MARWEPDARGRLAQAALELYAEHGFENTTVAEIAERAGLTERTFFRYFADKREVLFDGSAEFERQLVTPIANAPESDPPLQALAAGLTALGVFMQDYRERARARQALIDASPELRERELIKLAQLATAVAETLRGRGVEEQAASLTAEIGLAVFRTAFARWTADTADKPLSELIQDSLEDLRALSAGERQPVQVGEDSVRAGFARSS